MQDLGKWPRLLVTGTPVSTPRADEILIRTDRWLFATNDRQWSHVVAELTGIALNKHDYPELASLREFERRYGVLDLTYLRNDRIMSPTLGGPHGWCDWNGHVGCSTFNIGTYPTIEDVTIEWATIASAFPFLELTAQLVPESDDVEHPGVEHPGVEHPGVAHPAAEWRLHGGTVHLELTPPRLLRTIEQINPRAAIYDIALDPFRERGVNREHLQHALHHVRASIGDTPTSPTADPE